MQVIIECDTADEYQQAEYLRERIEKVALGYRVVVDAPVT